MSDIQKPSVESDESPREPAETTETPEMIDRRGHPRFAAYAQILDPKKLANEVEIRGQAAIFKYLSKTMGATDQPVPAVGTIKRILDGYPGSYASVNWVFTALSIEWRHITRAEHLGVGDRIGPKLIDDNLRFCIVFPRLAEMAGPLGISDIEMSSKSYVTGAEEIALVGASVWAPESRKPVRTDYIVRMRRGLPVRRDKVEGVIRMLREEYHFNINIDVETCS